MAETLNIVKHLAAVDTTVLILGETGTGKERIAQEIHYLSSRFDKAFVKVNCAALPSGLMESELFGHEKGAFTGAISSRAGRLEQANGGTIFLDEVGEIPLVAQSMLLRFLQEKEIQPIGGERTVNLDVRIIAATNKDLYDAVRKGEFRMDLYYRLNVFPITLPPLRERPEDIPILVRHFVRLYSLRHRKQISQITPAALNNLSDYCWPGNVRELENCMERTIVLTSGSIIDKIFLHPTPLLEVGKKGTIKTLAEIEKAYIQEVLAQARNRISGARGAAAMLNLPTSTLISRMKKLGLKK
jgi:transcriptional regulator with GAF, ATPase, and Fis domain